MSKFSNTPLCTIDVLALKPSRFLLPDELELPYRDAAGLVNVELLRRSTEQVSAGTVACSDGVRSTLSKWTKHAEAWLGSTGADTTTWLRGDDGVWRCGGEERRGLEPSRWDVLKGSGALPMPTPGSAAKSARREPSPTTSNKRPTNAAAPTAVPLPMAGLLQSPPPAAAVEAPDFKVEYAKSGRSSCKRCKEGIEKDELRFSRCVQSPHFDGKMDTWHHMGCFFDAKWAPKSHTEIVGVGTLRPADQRLIKQRAPSSAPSAGGPAAIDGDMQAEYAASGRAVCRHCNEKIDKGEPRVAYPGASESRPGMIVPKWHHLGCFFESEGSRPFWQGRSVSDFVGAASLSKAHRAELSAGLGSSAAAGEKRKGGGGDSGGAGASGAEHESSEAKRARVEAAQQLEAKLEKQAGSEWAVVDNLHKTLEPKELKAMLAANGAPTGGGEAAVEQRCVDGLLYGRMGPCPECGGDLGLASDGSAYRCSGDFSDFTKCTHRTQAPPRKPWAIPPQLLSSVPWLAKHDAKYKHKPRTKLFAAPLAPRAAAAAAAAAASSSGGASLPSKSTLQKSQYAAKETSMTIKVSGMGAVHEASGLQERGVVLQEKGRVYSETMSLADVASDTNSYYVLQVVHERGPEEFKGQNRHHVFRKWGRVGTTIGGQKLERMSKRDAIAEFERLFLDKTGSEFAQRDAMRNDPTAFKRAGKFLPVQLDHGADGDILELAANAGDGSALPRPTQQLVRTLFDVKLMRKLLLEFEVDTQKLPLGKLSKAQLAAAYGVLTQLHAALDEAAPVERLVLVDLSNQFYTLLPSLAPAVLDTTDKVRQKIELVDALRQLEVATSLLRSPRAERLQQRSLDVLDAHYAKLRCELALLEAGGAERAMVASYLANTHAPTHREYRLELEHAWRVERDGDAERFAPFAADANRQLLWHGSRTTNFAGILSQGLRIAPKEAPTTGYMFGKGVYFADMSSKSANYCAANRAERATGYLLLAEVALGGVHERTRAEFIEPARDLPPGKASVKGLGKTAPDPAAAVRTESGALVPLGAPKPSGVEDTALLYNEYIVYDPSRVAFRYLLQVKFVFE